MAHLNKRERVDAALRGDSVDRTPVAAWQHFIPAELAPDALAETSLRYFQQFDWDWLKVNPRSTYYAEAWGNTYDFNDYDGVRPRFVSGPVASAADLERIQPVSPTGGVFAEHLELLRFIKAGMVDAHFIQTVFSPLSVLAYLIAHPAENTQELSRQARYDALHRMMNENPQGTHAALGNIAQTLAGYATACLESGASGIFFAIVRLARVGVISQEEYATFGKPYDVQVLQAVQSAPFNMLHLCGEQAYFDLVADYPVHAINWATINQQNPDMAEAQRRTSMAVVGGVDETGVLQHGSPEEVISAAHAALQATNGRKVLLAPGCTTAMDVPAANLHALRRAAEPAA